MDNIWAFRGIYDKARQIKEAQDDYCAKATRGDWSGLGDYPEELQWEALVDVLRGRVKVTHDHARTTFQCLPVCRTGPHALLRDCRS